MGNWGTCPSPQWPSNTSFLLLHSVRWTAAYLVRMNYYYFFKQDKFKKSKKEPMFTRCNSMCNLLFQGRIEVESWKMWTELSMKDQHSCYIATSFPDDFCDELGGENNVLSSVFSSGPLLYENRGKSWGRLWFQVEIFAFLMKLASTPGHQTFNSNSMTITHPILLIPALKAKGFRTQLVLLHEVLVASSVAIQLCFWIPKCTCW